MNLPKDVVRTVPKQPSPQLSVENIQKCSKKKVNYLLDVTHRSKFESDGKGQITAFLYTFKHDNSYHVVTSSNKRTKFGIIHDFTDYILFLCVRNLPGFH
jgi:hypothetical protein